MNSIEKHLLDKPVIYKPCPTRMTLEPNKEYRWCKCGLSKTQPFCDESHEGTKFKPILFKTNESQLK